MTPLALDPNTLVAAYGAPPRLRPTQGGADNAFRQAQDFETVFVNEMLQHMFTGIGDDGPLGNAQGVGVWRSMLTEQFARNFVKAGGLGLAAHIYQSLMAHQGATAA
jgi:peptidoglycan hydrolase FlgJ